MFILGETIKSIFLSSIFNSSSQSGRLGAPGAEMRRESNYGRFSWERATWRCRAREVDKSVLRPRQRNQPSDDILSCCAYLVESSHSYKLALNYINSGGRWINFTSLIKADADSVRGSVAGRVTELVLIDISALDGVQWNCHIQVLLGKRYESCEIICMGIGGMDYLGGELGLYWENKIVEIQLN